jgi:hypothetical protein
MDVLETCLPQHLGLPRGGLWSTVTTSIAVATTGLLIGPLIITIIILHLLKGIIGNGGGSWRQVNSSRSSNEFGADRLHIRRLLFFVGVIEDDDIIVTRWPEDVADEVTKKFPGELCVTRSINDEIFLIRRLGEINHWSLLRGAALFENR